MGAMHSARVALAQRGSLSIGSSEIILDLGAHVLGGTILDILRTDEAMSTWFVVMLILLGIGALSLYGYDVWRVLIWIAFGWFVLDALLLGYRGGYR